MRIKKKKEGKKQINSEYMKNEIKKKHRCETKKECESEAARGR